MAANRELSSTLKNLKFMQRATQKKGETKIEESVGDLASSTAIKKCVVIYEADPQPDATSGRMSFLSFNPLIDKLNGGACEHSEPKSSTSSGRGNEEQSTRRSEASNPAKERLKSNPPSANDNADLKRKQVEVSPTANMSKMRKFDQNKLDSQRTADRRPNNNNNRKKLDWKVLQHPNSHSKKR